MEATAVPSGIRARSCMDKLAPKLIRRAAKKNYAAVVIDPIYKVLTGDENSADQMAAFCNQFDKVCHELGAAVIYCHHHSKGYQGQKRSMDRASGSGVFARDPDALLDLVQLETTPDLLRQQEGRAACDAIAAWLNTYAKDWQQYVGQDDALSENNFLAALRDVLNPEQLRAVNETAEKAKSTARQRTAWRIEGTLREFPRFEPVNVWFDYPVHRADDTGALRDIRPEGEIPPRERGTKSAQKSYEVKRIDRNLRIMQAYEKLEQEGMQATLLDLRHNPGGLLTECVKVSNYIVPKGPVVSITDKKGDTKVYESKLEKVKYPLAVLIDHGSASASEIVSAAVQDTKAGKLFGVKTYGKGCVQSVFHITTKTGLKLTTAMYYTPSGRSIHKVGVTPDVEIELPEKATVDVQLNKAEEYLRDELKKEK